MICKSARHMQQLNRAPTLPKAIHPLKQRLGFAFMVGSSFRTLSFENILLTARASRDELTSCADTASIFVLTVHTR